MRMNQKDFEKNINNGTIAQNKGKMTQYKDITVYSSLLVSLSIISYFKAIVN